MTRTAGVAALAAASFVLFVLIPGGQAIDAAALGATIVDQPLESQLDLFGALRRWSIPVLAVAALALGCVALWRRRLRLVSVAVLCTAVAVGASELLKRVLERPDLGVASYEHNTWPSGHAAAVCALALSCLWLCPPEWSSRSRRVIAWSLVGVVTLACHASVASYAHRPSDTIGAVLVAGAVFALPRHPGRQTSWSWARAGWLVLPLVGAVLLVLLAEGADAPRPLLAGASMLGLFWAAGWAFLPHTPMAQASARRMSRPAVS